MIFLQLAAYTDDTIESLEVNNKQKYEKTTTKSQRKPIKEIRQWKTHIKSWELSEKAFTVSIRLLKQRGFRFCLLGLGGMRKRSQPQISGRVLPLELSRSFTKRYDFYRPVSKINQPWATTSVNLHSGPFIQNLIHKRPYKTWKLPSKALLSKPTTTKAHSLSIITGS